MSEAELREEIVRLHAALRFYAEPEHWETEVRRPADPYGHKQPAIGAQEFRTESTNYWVPAAEMDRGQRARMALKEQRCRERLRSSGRMG